MVIIDHCMKKERVIGAVFIFSALLALVAYNSGTEKKRSLVQETFESSFDALKSSFLKDLTLPSEPKIVFTMELPSLSGGTPQAFTASSQTLQPHQTFRLLQLVEESNLFSLNSNPDLRNQIVLTLRMGEKEFLTRINPEILSRDPRVALLLKLFSTYATPYPNDHALHAQKIDNLERK